MSNSGVNTGFAKCFIFFMAVVILTEGTVYLGLSIWGIQLKQSSEETSDISTNPFKFAVDLIYFLDEGFGSHSVKLPGISEPVTLEVNFKEAEPVARRTFIFLITYAVISSLWIVTSLAIISTLCSPITKTINGLYFWPWFIFIIAGSVLDAVATGYHIHDVINTTSVEKTFKYLAITATEKTIEAFSSFDVYFVTPAVVMTCISSRFILIWLLNIVGASFCLSLTNTLSKRNSSKQSSMTSFATSSTAPVANLQEQSNQEISPASTQQTQELSSFSVGSKPAPTALQTQSSQRESPISPQTNQHTVPYNYQSIIIPLSNSCPTAPSPTESKEMSDYHNTDSHPQRNALQYQQELSPTSPLNNRYSTNNESFQYPMQNQRVSEELRSQLPWSYTSLPGPVAKKSQIQVYPEIPAPDYTH